MQKTMYVYILQCSDNSYYTGVTSNIDLRIKRHEEGFYKGSYTYNKRPVKLVYSAMFNDTSQAFAFEKQIKGWSRAKKEALMKNDFDKLIELSNQKKHG
jgi:putative endonuclease